MYNCKQSSESPKHSSALRTSARTFSSAHNRSESSSTALGITHLPVSPRPIPNSCSHPWKKSIIAETSFRVNFTPNRPTKKCTENWKRELSGTSKATRIWDGRTASVRGRKGNNRITGINPEMQSPSTERVARKRLQLHHQTNYARILQSLSLHR